MQMGAITLIAVLRLSKIALVAAVALTTSLVAFGNLTDYGTNWTFVVHVLSMDTIFPDATIRYRAITDPTLQKLGYWLIIACELATAALGWVGAVMLLAATKAPVDRFIRAKAVAVAGLTLGFLTWQVGFMAIGAEWFGMWQSSVWNGEQSAFRFHMTIFAVLIYLVLPEPDRFS
jgi:predicted small integral membrane protein